MLQAVVFDLDDTLLRGDRTISDFTIGVLRQAARRGVHVIPASGRAKESMAHYVDQIGCASAYIACNGSELWSADHRLLQQMVMSPALARECVAFGQSHGCYTHFYRGKYFYYHKQGSYAEEYAASSALTPMWVEDLEAALTEDTVKVLLMDDPASIRQLIPLAAHQFDGRLTVTSSKPIFLEMNPFGATKGNALTEAARLLGFDLKHTAAFGDGQNDLPMLEIAGHAFAMANAQPEVHARIPRCCPSNEDDGVAHTLQIMLTEEEQP